MTITPNRNQVKTKNCPKCKAKGQRIGTEWCNECGHKFKPRTLGFHEIKGRFWELQSFFYVTDYQDKFLSTIVYQLPHQGFPTGLQLR